MAQLVKVVDGLAIASAKVVDALAIASVKTILGLDNTSGGGSAPSPTANFGAIDNSVSNNSFTQAVDCTGANYLLLFVFAEASTAFTGDFLTATHAGSPMLELSENDPLATGAVVAKVFRILNPTTGTNNVVLSTVGSNYSSIALIWVPMTGVNGTTPEGTTVTNFAVDTAPTATVSSATNELVVAYVYASASISSNGAGQTTIVTDTIGGDEQRVTSKAGAASVVSSWTISGAAPWVVFSVPVKP